MANATYQSPVINTQAKRTLAYDSLSVLIVHIQNQTGGYNFDIVSIDFNVTTANRITITVSAPIPTEQLPRYNLTQTA